MSFDPDNPESSFKTLLGDAADEWQVHGEDPIGDDLRIDPALEDSPPQPGICWFYPRHRSAPGEEIARGRTTRPVTVDEHQADAERFARQLTDLVPLSPEVRSAVVFAAAHHDEGKRRLPWQRGIGNTDPTKSLAKTINARFDRSKTEGYRHEFGSLIDLVKPGPLDTEIAQHPERDLILHLVASHHAWARPHFKPDGHDPEHPQLSHTVAAEAALRFQRLQRRFGWWQLAYLESLVRSADALASQQACKP